MPAQLPPYVASRTLIALPCFLSAAAASSGVRAIQTAAKPAIASAATWRMGVLPEIDLVGPRIDADPTAMREPGSAGPVPAPRADEHGFSSRIHRVARSVAISEKCSVRALPR